MKSAIMVHGWGGSPKEPMLNWIKKQLEKLGYKVFSPQMPNPDEPGIAIWTGFLKKNIKSVDPETIIIGHSIGCQAVLRYMKTLPIKVKVKKVILLAPWMKLDEKTIKEEGEEVVAIAKPWVETPINWEKVKRHCDNFICIFSDNDPYVPLSNKELFKIRLNVKSIVLHNKYHFDMGHGILKLPEILEFLE